jgi:hypothetical protein
MEESNFHRLLADTVKVSAVGIVIAGVASLFWPFDALGVMVGLILGNLDLLATGYRLPLWAKASRGTALWLVNARFVFRLGLLALAFYLLDKWAGAGILWWVLAGLFFRQPPTNGR